MIAIPGLTELEMFYVASVTGAILFFVAGAALVALRRTHRAAELARLRAALTDSDTLARDHAATSSQLRSELELQRRQLVDQQARARDGSRELLEAQARLRVAERELETTRAMVEHVERELAARSTNIREIVGENDRLQRRLADAEALRSEYVRLRTTITDSEFLKSEVARLQEELRQVKVAALTGPSALQPRRQARGCSGMPAAPRSISESLAWTIERFADTTTRGSAIADTLGFPLASTGDDGVALAAYGALVMETANRAKQFLPLAAPRSIEIVDERGARVTAWTFDVEGEPLLLVNLAVGEVDRRRVEATLADLSEILAPSTSVAKGA